MFWVPIIMAASALLKNKQDQAAEQRDRYIQAETARMSPWTNMKPQPVNYAQPANTAMQGVGSILAYQQGQKRDEQMDKLLQSKYGQPQEAPRQPAANMQLVDYAGDGQSVDDDKINSILESIMGKGAGSNNVWGGLSSGIGSLYS